MTATAFLRHTILLLAALGAGVAAQTARADTVACGYAASLRALTGPAGTDLTVSVTKDAPACAEATALKKVQLKTYAPDGALTRVSNVNDVAAPGGVGALALEPLARAQRLEADVLVQTGTPERTYVLRAETKTLLRPDLVVASVSAPTRSLRGRELTIDAAIAERNGDIAASATVTLTVNGAAVASQPVTVPAGGTEKVSFKLTPAATGAAAVELTVGGADPRETDDANNAGRAAVEVDDFILDSSQVLVPSLVGYGTQFNQHVFSPLTPAPPSSFPDLEAKVVAGEPQFVRIFFDRTRELGTDKRYLDSFVRTVLLAQRAGATINVTWQSGGFDDPTLWMGRFATVLVDLVKNKGVTRLRWVTIQNEVNSTKITPEQNEAMYRALDKALAAAGVRGQIRFMGGDLVRDNQRVWFDYMAGHMADILDAWSIHVFWDYWDTAKLQARLNEVMEIWAQEPEAGRKPLYVTEYGVRGIKTLNGVTADPGFWQDGTPISRTNVNAFQQAWFDVLAARLGYRGAIKWDSYWGKYDNGTQAYYTIGPQSEGWPLYPIYHFVRLLTMTIKPDWKVVGLDAGAGTKLAASYSGPSGELTLVGLDTAGAALNAVSPTQVDYALGGLPPLASFRLVQWNATGDGTNAVVGTVVADGAGVAHVTVPQHAVFALTTLPV